VETASDPEQPITDASNAMLKADGYAFFGIWVLLLGGKWANEGTLASIAAEMPWRTVFLRERKMTAALFFRGPAASRAPADAKHGARQHDGDLPASRTTRARSLAAAAPCLVGGSGRGSAARSRRSAA
jgi:hypothetical protein